MAAVVPPGNEVYSDGDAVALLSLIPCGSISVWLVPHGMKVYSVGQRGFHLFWVLFSFSFCIWSSCRVLSSYFPEVVPLYSLRFFYMTLLTFFFNFDQYYLINQLVKWSEMSTFTSIIKNLLNLTWRFGYLYKYL